jgi:protein involved in polysaccharide export with SLBB domain
MRVMSRQSDRSSPSRGPLVRGAIRTCLLVFCLLGLPLAARSQDDDGKARDAHSPRQTRAVRDANLLVTLSADRVNALLRQEPGLLLQLKKRLAEQAFEQGRILEAADLSDEAVFRLVQSDDQVRNIATREIAERDYITVKPSRAEIEQLELRKNQSARRRSELDQAGRRTERDLPRVRRRSNSHPSYEGPSRNRDSRDSPREVMSAGSQPSQESPDGEELPSPRGPRTIPAVLPAEVNASYQGRASISEVNSDERSASRSGSPAASAWGSASGATAAALNSVPRSAPDDDSADERGTLDPYHVQRPYVGVSSLYDLYSSYSRKQRPLRRFGENVFASDAVERDQLAADLPLGPDYVVGPGDGLTIELWGGVSQSLRRVVDREGRIALPESGEISVAGRSLEAVQQMVSAILRRQFRDIQADVSLSRVRTLQIYVVGDVRYPGAYEVSSLSTPLNALALAGGPTSGGSLRRLRHLRGERLVEEIDLYDFLLRGVRPAGERLEPGDTIQVPTAGPQVTLEGYVRRPAIYELKSEKSLAAGIELAGGLLATATLHHIEVQHVEEHQSHTTLQLELSPSQDSAAMKQMQSFTLGDGDTVRVLPIFPYSEKCVYLEGHVLRPGKAAFHDGMKITDLLGSYNRLLPEPYLEHAEIIRLDPADYQPGVLTFNLADALQGSNQDLELKPFDIVHIYGRFDFEDNPVITITGEVRRPGDHLTHGVTHLRDAIFLAGGPTPEALLDHAEVLRSTRNGATRVLSVNLARALAGEGESNILLDPKDRVIVHRSPARVEPPVVTIQGQVVTAGKYPLDPEMTAAALVRLAGGFKRGAYTEIADLTSQNMNAGNGATVEHRRVRIAEALAGSSAADAPLRDGDVLTISQVAGWKDLGATVTLDGEVPHPAAYGIIPGERLSSVLTRAGGFTADAFPYGAVLERVQVRELEEKNRAVLLREIQDQEPSLALAPENDAQQKVAREAALQQWKSTLDELQNSPPSGRLVVHISADVRRWANTAADPPLRAGDLVYIPKRPNLVLVNGSVYNPTAVSFKPGKDAAWYLKQAGGPTAMANRKAMFVIRADGSVAGNGGGFLGGGFGGTELRPGDMVVVPEKAFSTNTRWKSTLEGAQLAYAIGIAIQVARSF